MNVRSGNAPSDVFFFPFGLWQVDVLRPCWNPLWRFVRYSHCAVKLHDQVMDFWIAWGIMSGELCWQIVEMGARIPLRGRISDCNLLVVYMVNPTLCSPPLGLVRQSVSLSVLPLGSGPPLVPNKKAPVAASQVKSSRGGFATMKR